MREGLAYSMVIGMSVAFIWHFSRIAKHGNVIIQEPHPVMLAFEIIMLCAFLVFGMVSLIKLLRGIYMAHGQPESDPHD